MSQFQVPVVRLTIKPHPNADKLELAEVSGYRCVVGKGDFQTGDSAVYIPEGSIVPDVLIEKMGLTDRLAGPQKNRVKAMKLRGILSQGLVCSMDIARPWRHGEFDVGDCCAEILGITKYEPPLPAELVGNVWNAGSARTIQYDIENFKKYDKVFEEGEQVVFTEKIHGTWCMAAWMPLDLEDEEQGKVFVSSKGQAARGLCLKAPVEPDPQSWWQRVSTRTWTKIQKAYELEQRLTPWKDTPEVRKTTEDYFKRQIKNTFNKGINNNNLYWRAVIQHKVFQNLVYAVPHHWLTAPIFILGEVFGIQDLAYEATTNKPGFRVFDIYVGIPGVGRYLNDTELEEVIYGLRLERVPVLYRGPFSQEKVDEYTSGLEAVTGASKHIREGIVIRPVQERVQGTLGRVQLKSVSEEYLLRKGNTTEFN
jgi:RNA ligase (TIGR02306 family)